MAESNKGNTYLHTDRLIVNKNFILLPALQKPILDRRPVTLKFRSERTMGLKRYAKVWPSHLIGQCDIDKQ